MNGAKSWVLADFRASGILTSEMKACTKYVEANEKKRDKSVVENFRNGFLCAQLRYVNTTTFLISPRAAQTKAEAYDASSYKPSFPQITSISNDQY